MDGLDDSDVADNCFPDPEIKVNEELDSSKFKS